MFEAMEAVMQRWLAHVAMRRYADTRAEIDALEARAARELGEAVKAYEWPACQPQHPVVDKLRARQIAERPYMEDLIEELATANRCPESVAEHLVADVTHLMRDLPACWGKVTDPTVMAPLWQGGTIVNKCAGLKPKQLAQVDASVSVGLGSVEFGRLSRRTAAAIKRTDPDGARLKAKASAAERFVRVKPDPVDELSSWLVARLDTRDALVLEDTLRLLSGKLAADGDRRPLDVRRAAALGMLAAGGPASALTRRTQLYVHVWRESLGCPDEVARVEGVGPVLLDQVKELTQGSRVRVTPVLDTAADVGVDRYEIPDRIAEQVLARHPHVAVPWGGRESRGQDKDHVKPWRAGKKRQTRAGNLIPQTRGWHRAKTHAGFHVEVPWPGACLWMTAAGQRVLVDQRGTHRLPPMRQ